MNYRHLYHAGNFADVFKHILLVKILEKMQAKETPLCVLDTHAGIGLYDLSSEEAGKTGEYRSGIDRLFNAPSLPGSFSLYMQTIRSFNQDALRHYPGSPSIARALLRPQDRLVLAELHPEDAITLKRLFLRDDQTAVHHTNGYQAMKAFLPPKEKRGLVLIDPPFEKTDEFDTLVEALKMASQRFRQGVYAIWYPIKDRPPVQRFHNALAEAKLGETLIIECMVSASHSAETLNGCGIAIINAPWNLDKDANDWLPALLPFLEQENGSITVEWLPPPD